MKNKIKIIYRRKPNKQSKLKDQKIIYKIEKQKIYMKSKTKKIYIC